MEPRLRTVNKVKPPYTLNHFPNSFVKKLGEEITYMRATKEAMALEGNEWEQIFATCVGADWKPSNVGLDDVVLGNCCWGAKTVFGVNLKNKKTVRLICGRNSPIYSFGEGNITTEADPNHIGKLVLEIWNERVSAVREIFKFVRTVVLVKSMDFSQYLIFETDTVRYDPEQFYFEWNKKGNLEGFSKDTHFHKFTWQPHGSQFTIIEEIPENRLHIQLKEPEKLSKETVLSNLGFDESWIVVFDD